VCVCACVRGVGGGGGRGVELLRECVFIFQERNCGSALTVVCIYPPSNTEESE
jgi:hypothetical protein